MAWSRPSWGGRQPCFRAGCAGRRLRCLVADGAAGLRGAGQV